ncbi:Zinc finger protein 16-like [Taenia solium]|eukprot:TsM_000225600 transcript=TsM_000225600 gene=TsM_000225600
MVRPRTSELCQIRGLEEKPKQQVAAQDTPSVSSSEGMEEEIKLLEALVIDPEDETRFLAEIGEMLRNNDSHLKYVLDGKAIQNPFVADREAQLSCLMDLFCVENTDGGYKCAACDEEHNELDGMHQHLLQHSDCKFFFCVRCLEGFSTLSEMKCHTMAHTGAI